MIRVKSLRAAAAFILLLTVFQPGCSSFPTIELPKDYKIDSKRTITVYVSPSGVEDFDETYSRVMCLDLQSKGYKSINANEELRKNGDSLIWTDHRAIADLITSKEYLPKTDLIVVVKPSWNEVNFITEINEKYTMGETVYETAGFKVWRLYSETIFYDTDLHSTVLSYSALDTTHTIMDEKSKRYYPELPWMLIARQLSSASSQVKICTIENVSAADQKFPVSLWVDKSYREAFPDNWANQIQLRMLYVNDILRSQLGIELEVREINSWDTEFDSSLEYMLQKLLMVKNPQGNICIGITLDEKLKALSTDRASLGLAYPLQKSAIISAQPTFPGLRLWRPVQEAITMAHEIGHLFGCIHVNDMHSIMYPLSTGLTYKFDEVNVKIAKHMKDYYTMPDKFVRLKEYALKLMEIKNNSPENTFLILSSINAAFLNIFAQEQLSYEDSGKLERDLCKIIPDQACALAAAGCIDYKKKKLPDAAEYFRRALEINPDFAEAHYYLGTILEKLGEKTEAEEHLEKTKPYSKYWVIDKSF